MPYEIELTDDSKRDIQLLRPFDRRKVLDAIERHLRHEPTKESRSRIKRYVNWHDRLIGGPTGRSS
jgi:mRNA interferase RelE/StbE